MPVRKKKPLRKASAKSVKALASKTAKSNAKFRKADSRIKAELSKLQNGLAKLEKNPKAKKRELNEYNLFMRRQLRLGKTFRQAVAAWKRFKKLLSKRKPSAYNSFIASQLKQGKSFKDSVALWKRLKSGRPGKTRTVTKIKRVLVKSKPKVKYVVRTKFVEKPADATAFLPVEIEKIAERIAKKIKEPEHGLPIEEIAHRMLTLYFEEPAPFDKSSMVSSVESLRVRLIFDQPQKFVAKGQSAVFYSDSGETLGGGVIL